MRKSMLLAAVAAAILAGPAWAQPADIGVAAFAAEEYDAALAVFRPRAIQGDMIAQYHLGLAYSLGLGVDVDPETALRWFAGAAVRGHIAAEVAVGAAYAAGSGVEQNDEEAVRWYSMAANDGDTAAQVLLGQAYQLGRGVPASGYMAAQWFARADAQRAASVWPDGTPIAATASVPADFVITLSWPDGSPDDVDLFVREPGGGIVSYSVPYAGPLEHEGDDTGGGRQASQPYNGVDQVGFNEETVTIRGIVAGEYVINARLFGTATQPVPVALSVVRLNPTYDTVFYRTYELTDDGDELTAIRITLDARGNVRSLGYEQEPLAAAALGFEGAAAQ